MDGVEEMADQVALSQLRLTLRGNHGRKRNDRLSQGNKGRLTCPCGVRIRMRVRGWISVPSYATTCTYSTVGITRTVASKFPFVSDYLWYNKLTV